MMGARTDPNSLDFTDWDLERFSFSGRLDEASRGRIESAAGALAAGRRVDVDLSGVVSANAAACLALSDLLRAGSKAGRGTLRISGAARLAKDLVETRRAGDEAWCMLSALLLRELARAGAIR